MKYRKKVLVDAVQFPNKQMPGIVRHGRRTRYPDCPFEGKLHMHIPTLEGDMIASEGDWIITGVHGEKYPCKPDIFAQTYEAVPEAENDPGRKVGEGDGPTGKSVGDVRVQGTGSGLVEGVSAADGGTRDPD